MAEETKTSEARTGVKAVPPPGSAAPTAKVEEKRDREGRSVARRETSRQPAPRYGGNGRPTNPDEMRAEIERTRTRMSSTLDAIEARIGYERAELERKKERALEKLTLQGPRQKLSRQPWKSIAIAFAAGYIVAAIRD